MKYFFLPAFFLAAFLIHGQDNGFPFGQVSYKDLDMITYERDTSASAVVLNEFGEAYMEDGNHYNLIFIYHAKIKILKKTGQKYGDIEIPLLKLGTDREEILRSVKASAFNKENGSIKEFPLNPKNIFTENRNKRDVMKFAIPNVKEGSVIEFQYTVESPFVRNFKNWEFQSEIPKVSSEYWASIPGHYLYNITMRGFLQLSKNETSLVKDCFSLNGSKADCALYKYAMKDIPAFIEEDFMTAKSNFLSMINFELMELRYPDGRVDKITNEWRDAEQELRKEQRFGVQLKKGKDIDEHVKILIGNEIDPLNKAKKIYYFIKDWFRWDEKFGMYSELGIKKAFDQKTGNVGDINLSLIAALRYADLDAEPVILSTRANGAPIELHPVITDFNYVIAKVNIGDKVYLLDATDDFHPFGFLPFRCLNGKGRVLAEKQSYWIDVKPADKAKELSVLTLKLGKDGVITGTMQTNYVGYEAINERKKIRSFSSQKEYIESISNELNGIEITEFELRNTEEIEKPLGRILTVRLQAFDNLNTNNFLLNPFFMDKWKENPFKSQERLYPVDFGIPMDYVTILNLEFPSEFEVVNWPEKTGLALPNAGGRYVFEMQNLGNKLSMNHALLISKTVFSSTEYHYLKELFARIIQIQSGDLLFKKKV